ncbi:glutathione S-transferase [Auriculariales sp. MPI-PUGE-AT-0066]|nr:glutathione S-transferase [Auriculariales sp. MPI-PUGE-AT-0066]
MLRQRLLPLAVSSAARVLKPRIPSPHRYLTLSSSIASTRPPTHYPLHTRTMSTQSRDVSSQSDISKQTAAAEFKRQPSSFRESISRAPGAPFAPAKGRYHLYVSYACPWATRTLIVRALKKLEPYIGLTVVSPRMGENGWPFAKSDAFPGAGDDPHEGASHVKDLYLTANPKYEGRFTVPVLWDIQNRTIVNNESSEIIRMLNTEFDDLLRADGQNEAADLDLYPENLRTDIDELNGWVYDSVNNGVYKSGFARSQEAYLANVKPLFESLDKLEKILKDRDYLFGPGRGVLTEADVRLWVTIIRFDPVYVGHFKCNLRTIRDGYPEINRWTKQLYWNNSSFKGATNFDHIKTHYYWSHPHINPTRVVPFGPEPHIQPL